VAESCILTIESDGNDFLTV